MNLDHKKVEVIKLAIERANALFECGEKPEYIYLCHLFDHFMYFQRHGDLELCRAGEEMIGYIRRGIGMKYTFTQWLEEACPIFGSSEEVPSNIAFMARICWLERLVYYHEQGYSSVMDNGRDFEYVPF